MDHDARSLKNRTPNSTKKKCDKYWQILSDLPGPVVAADDTRKFAFFRIFSAI